MSEDAPVNTGAAAWPDENTAYFAVRRMQTKLHHWATQEPGRRFGDLHNLVYDPAFLVVAWARVRGNKGARTPGVDGATVAGRPVGVAIDSRETTGPVSRAPSSSSPGPSPPARAPATRAARSSPST